MRKIFSSVLLLILFVQLLGFVFAQDTIPGIPSSASAEPGGMYQSTDEEIRAFAEQRAWKDFLFNLSLVIDALISLGLGFFIIKKMIRTNPRITNLIIHGIIFLGTLTVFIIVLVDGIRCLLSPYCGFPTFLYSFIILTSLMAVILLLIILIEIIKKKEGNKYKVNLSGSIFFVWIIFTILTPLSEIIVQPNYDLPVFLFLPVISFPIMLILYFILGVIGYFIDKSKRVS